LRAEMRTSLSAKLSASGGLLLGIFVVLAILLLAALILNAFRPSEETRAIIRIIPWLLGVVIAMSIFVSTPFGRKPVSNQFALTTADGKRLDTRNVSFAEILPLLQDILQNRQPLPPPAGEVTGSPSDASAIRAYSEAERQAMAEAIRLAAESQMKGFTELIHSEIRSALRTLPTQIGSDAVPPTPGVSSKSAS
jgi:hypothetical protein